MFYSKKDFFFQWSYAMNKNYGILLAIALFLSSSVNFAAEMPNPAELKSKKQSLETKRRMIYVTLAFVMLATAYTTAGAIKHINLAYSLFPKGEFASFTDFLRDYYGVYFPQKVEEIGKGKLRLNSSDRLLGNIDLGEKEQKYKEMNLNQDESETLGIATIGIPLFPVVSLSMFFIIRYLINKAQSYTKEIAAIDAQLQQ
jgi:hypothetical protein